MNFWERKKMNFQERKKINFQERKKIVLNYFYIVLSKLIYINILNIDLRFD